ncbi:MAG: retropepsin-like aspartic protease [Blastocatellia bacterium]
MTIIRKLHFEGSKGQADLTSLFDGGSTYSCIHPDYAEQLGVLEALPRPQKVETAAKGHFIEIEQRMNLDFYLNNLRLSDEFVIIPNLAEQAIIGALTIQKWKIKLDYETDEVITDPRVSRIILM